MDSSTTTTVATPLGPFWLWATPLGVCAAGFGAEIASRELRRLARYGIDKPTHAPSGHLEEAVTQVEAYFGHSLRVFTVPLDLRGTVFQLAVWEQLAAVPYGKTRTYGEIALALGNPRGCQAVGQAVGSNPVAIIVPCHRIVGHDGRLTGYAGGIERKEALLELEAYGYQLPILDLPGGPPRRRGAH